MTKLQGRAIMRGKKLDSFCYKSKAIYYEYGPNDNRVFCWGLNDARTDEPYEDYEDLIETEFCELEVGENE